MQSGTATECLSSEEQCACQPGASSCSLTLGEDVKASSSTSVDMSLPAPMVTVTIE